MSVRKGRGQTGVPPLIRVRKKHISQKTLSEGLFEKFCDDHGIRYDKIMPSNNPTPDYDIYLGSQKIVCEVKQIDLNEEERAYKREEIKRLSPWPGNRVRNCINDAARQIRARAKGKYPGLLVIYNNVKYRELVSGWSVLTAMYGEETVVIDVPNDEETDDIDVPNYPEFEPVLRNVVFGDKWKMNPKHNTSVSAVAVLRCAAGTTPLCIYHNAYATIPLNPNLLDLPSVSHFFVKLKNDGTFSEWHMFEDAQET